MRIVLVGATGTIGRAVAAELGQRHEVVAVGSRSGDVRMDMTDLGSVRAAYEQIGRFDAVVCAAGKVKFGPLGQIDAAGYGVGLADKLMGQVNLVLEGLGTIADGGSFTLTGGILSRDPVVAGSSASMVNAAIEGFVRAAAIELPRGLRINAVSPGLLRELVEAYGAFFRGHDPVPGARVALAYSKSVEGARTGQVFEVF